ncbi:unnamed protein product [Clavelina lepadiformis]|uniref:Uncharacterized protein n=1 Tax=Clavelina lepadiformis TaxID=159417 RepID=A0ABP0GH31_CLALP
MEFVHTEIGPICDGRIYDPIRKMCCGDALADIRTHLCHWPTGTLVDKSNFYHNKGCLTDKKLLCYRSGEGNGEKQVCRKYQQNIPVHLNCLDHHYIVAKFVRLKISNYSIQENGPIRLSDPGI